ncbi:MAG TPA: hypothetical protein VEC16_04980 [Alphaproteobacteria bacterium]|nr:hypothetical protein [Alphaproteobacteria bacterium]
MYIDIISDYPLRGVMIENMARIVLRRSKNNNFIFGCRYFDSIDEIISKYKLDCSEVLRIVNFIRSAGLKTDLIEFDVYDKISRKVKSINFYDVKSKIRGAVREYFDICVTSFEFLENISRLGGGAFIITVLIDFKWQVNMEIFPLLDAKIRIYDSQTNRTKFLIN